MSLSNFLTRPGLLGNESGAESDFEENGTLLLPKEEEQSEDSEAEGGYCHPDERDRNTPKNLQQHRPEACSTSTQVEAADTEVDTPDSPSEDDEPPNVETVKTARNLVVFNSTQQLFENTGTTTALLQALAKFRFKFETPEGITKTCGEDFLDIDIPKEAKVRSIRAKKKGTGKKSTPGHISAQERDPEVLVLEISDEESEMLKDPAVSRDENTAGPSGLIEDKIRGRKKLKEKVVAPQRFDGSENPKRKSSPRHQWIKFYHAENTKAFKQAKELRASHQLLVHGLPKTFLGPTQAGPQERAMNELMAGLNKKTLGEDGIDITQENIIGAYPIEPTPSGKSPITKITLDSRDTKASIRKAAEKADRWGNGTHSVFFRDITLDKRKRKSSNEDLNTPKKGKLEDTPRRGREPKGKRLAEIRRESRGEERSRTVGQRQKEQDDLERQRIQIKEDQPKARTAKWEHQQKEEKEAQEKASGQENAGPSQEKISPVKQSPSEPLTRSTCKSWYPPGHPTAGTRRVPPSLRSTKQKKVLKFFSREEAMKRSNYRTPSRNSKT